MNYPVTNFYVDSNEDAAYICFLAKSIVNNFYQKSGYFVLPYAKDSTNTCYFPDLDYPQYFWELIKSNRNTHFGGNFSVEAVNIVSRALEKNNLIKDININRNSIASHWKQKEPNFYSLVHNFLIPEDLLSKVRAVHILITQFGTAGSFFPKKVDGGYEIFMTQRADLDADMIGKTLLLALDKIKTISDGAKDLSVWYKRQDRVEYLLSHTAFKKILPAASKAILRNSEKIQNTITDSTNYLSKIGFPVNETVWMKSGCLYKTGKDITALFSKNELALLEMLIINKGKVVDYDSIASALWGKDELNKFSLYAIAKTIQNIRKKFRNEGVNKEIIKSVRGLGYVFC